MSIEEYLEQRYWVIDFLPRQVAADSQGQYFKIEEFFLKQPRFGVICQKFSHIMLKLNCYYDIALYTCESDEWTYNPPPESVDEWFQSGKTIYFVLPSEEAMIGFNGDDLYMTLYHPDASLLELVTTLAAAEGLFVWEPKAP